MAGSRRSVRARAVTIPAGVPIGRRRRQDDRPRPVGHAHARDADRMGAGVSRRRRHDGPRHGERVPSSSLRCATPSRRGAPLGPRLAAGRARSMAAGPTPSASTTRRRRTKRSRWSAKYHDAGFQQIKIYSLDHAADRRSDLRRGAPPGHDGHRSRSQRHDDRAGRGRRHGSDRAPGHSRRGRIGRGARDDRVSPGSQDGDGSDAVVERAARTRRRRADRGVPARRREDSAAAQPACSRMPARPAIDAADRAQRASSAGCGSSRRSTMPACRSSSAPTKESPGTASTARSSCTSRPG